MISYFTDMAIVDERLSKLEEGYSEIIKLLECLSADINNITNGGNNNGIKEAKEQNAVKDSKR